MKILDIIHVNADDIKGLNEYEQSNLLDKLFRYEFASNELEISGLTLSSNPKIKDQGIDAIITEPLPEGLDFLPEGISIFQFKATSSNYNVKKEFCKKAEDTEKWQLKPLMKKYLEEKATYILINTQIVLTILQKNLLKEKILTQLNEINPGLDFPIRIYTADDIARWCDKYPVFRLQFNKLAFAKGFDDWKDEIRKNIVKDTFRTSEINSLIWDIFSSINTSEESSNILRIIGDQGIGKKTLLIESLDQLPSIKKSNIVILDAKLNDIKTISKAIYYFSVNAGILVILDCSDEYHNEISQKLNATQLKDLVLISLNSQSYIDKSRIFKGTKIIVVPRWNDRDIEELLKMIDPSIPYHLSSQIVKYSQGIPDLIINIYDMLKSEDYEIYKSDTLELFCESIIEFLINNSSFDRVLLTRILVGFSLFTYLGWDLADYRELTSEGTYKYKYEKNVKKFAKILDLERKIVQIEEIVNYLLKVRILRMRGRLIYITSRVLAIHILKNYTPENKLIEYFNRIRDLKDDHFLNKFLERLEDFSAEDIGKKIVKLILNTPFFDNWSKINNKETSVILVKLSRINNRLVIKKLAELFKETEYNQLKKELRSRRELISSLEHIIWFENTFEDGMNILLKLAIAENETYANNATGTFREKFAIYLPGTSTSLFDRMSYLEKLYEKDEDEINNQILNSLPIVFSLEYYSRSVYAEIQGLKPLPEEYYPKSKAEIQEYLNKGFKILEKYLKSSNIEIKKDSYNILNNNFIKFLDLGLWEKIKEYWLRYIKIENTNKFEILEIINRKMYREESKLNNLKSQIKKGLGDDDYEANIKDQFIVNIIKGILKEIENNNDKGNESELEKIYENLIDQKLITSQRDYSRLEEFQKEIKMSFTLIDEIEWLLRNVDDWYKVGINYEDHLKNQGKIVVQKIYANPKFIEEALKFLITKEDYIIYPIGEEFVKLDPFYEKWTLIKKIFMNNKNSRKPNFIIGYLSNYRLNEPDKYNKLIDEIIKEEGLSKELFDFAIRKELDEWSVDLIIKLYENKFIDDLDLMSFSNPIRVKSLDKSLFIKLITFYFKNVKDPLHVPRGSIGDHLFILYDYLKVHKDVIPEIKETLFEIITSFKHFESEQIIETDPPMKIPRHINLSQFWRQIVELFIEECPEILDSVRNEILEHLLKLPTLTSQPDVQLLFIKFLEIDKEGTWEAFSQKFINNTSIPQFFQFYFNYDFLSKIPDDWIIELCKNDPEHFPQIIAQMIDEIIRRFESPPNLIVNLIEEFYDNTKFTNRLIYSFESGVKMYLPGRSADIPHSHIKILEMWKNKSNSKKFLDWIDDAKDYLTNEVKQAKMRDEEDFEPAHDLGVQDDYYDKEKWINSIKDQYVGETIAFTNIDESWTLLAHSSEEDDLFEELKKKYEKKEIDKKYKVRFRKL